MKKILLSIIILFSLTKTFACSCMLIDESLSKKVVKAFSKSNLIIRGKVTAIEIVNKEKRTSSDDPIIYKFEIIQVIKGDLKKRTIDIVSERSEASCGYNFKLGTLYLVYAIKSTHFSSRTNNKFNFVTGLCSRNQELIHVHKKELRKLKKLRCKNDK